MNKLTESEEKEYNAIRKILFAKKDFWSSINQMEEQLIVNRYTFLSNKKTKNILNYEESNIKR